MKSACEALAVACAESLKVRSGRPRMFAAAATRPRQARRSCSPHMGLPVDTDVGVPMNGRAVEYHVNEEKGTGSSTMPLSSGAVI